MNMATQLYKSDMYIQQQKSTLEQILNSMNQVDAGLPTAGTTTPTAADATAPADTTAPAELPAVK